MSWKGMITEDHRCQGHEIGLLPSIGDGEPAEVLSRGMTWTLSMLEVNLAEEWWIFQYSHTKDPRHNLYSLTLVCLYQHWLLYCLKYCLALKSTLNGFFPSLSMLFFFRSKASEGSNQLLSGCGLCDCFLWCQEACFISSFLSLFLAVIAKKLTPQ